MTNFSFLVYFWTPQTLVRATPPLELWYSIFCCVTTPTPTCSFGLLSTVLPRFLYRLSTTLYQVFVQPHVSFVLLLEPGNAPCLPTLKCNNPTRYGATTFGPIPEVHHTLFFPSNISLKGRRSIQTTIFPSPKLQDSIFNKPKRSRRSKRRGRTSIPPHQFTIPSHLTL